MSDLLRALPSVIENIKIIKNKGGVFNDLLAYSLLGNRDHQFVMKNTAENIFDLYMEYSEFICFTEEQAISIHKTLKGRTFSLLSSAGDSLLSISQNPYSTPSEDCHIDIHFTDSGFIVSRIGSVIYSSKYWKEILQFIKAEL